MLYEPMFEPLGDFSEHPNLWHDAVFASALHTQFDLVQRSRAVLDGGTIVAPGDLGLGIKTSSSGDTLTFPGNLAYSPDWNESLMLLVAVDITGTNGSNPGILSYRDSAITWELYKNGSDIKFSFAKPTLYTLTFSGKWPGNGFHIFGLWFQDTGSTRDATLFIDGVNEGTQGINQNPITTLEELVFGGLWQGSTHNVFGTYYSAALISPNTAAASGQSPSSRFDPALEARKFHEDPFAFVRVADFAPSFAVAAAGGSGFPVPLLAPRQNTLLRM